MSIVEYSVNLNLFLCHLFLIKRNKLLCSIRIHNVRPTISIISHKICLQTQIYELEKIQQNLNDVQKTLMRVFETKTDKSSSRLQHHLIPIFFLFSLFFSLSCYANNLNAICCRLSVKQMVRCM